MLSSNVVFETTSSKMAHQQQPQVTRIQQTNVKVTKTRRTRQPRNPQLSVARRNERERNRVKMVNNGFALLREHLPFEDLQACEQSAGSGQDTPTPGDTKNGGKSGAKKFSKVETLRAAIQRIRMLEELIRSTEPDFESINIGPSAAGNAAAAAYELGEEALSEPLSCGSASSQSATSNTTTSLHHQQSSQQQIIGHQYHQSSEHFVKLEPQQHQQVSPANSMPSPQNSQNSHTSGLNQNQYNQQSHQQSHTHLWIQQHQNSFLEQQQQQHYQHWYPQQPQQQHQQQQQQQQRQLDQESTWFVASESPDNLMGNQQHLSQNQQQQANSMEPIWFQSSANAPSSHPSLQPSNSQPSPAFANSIGQHHQISLYSQ